MFLGGAGLAQALLFCRHKIYPIGLPNWLSHVIAEVLVSLSVLIGAGARWSPVGPPQPGRVSRRRGDQAEGGFCLLVVTTLGPLLPKWSAHNDHPGQHQFIAIERRR